jgi:hypothetical protein
MFVFSVGVCSVWNGCGKYVEKAARCQCVYDVCALCVCM